MTYRNCGLFLSLAAAAILANGQTAKSVRLPFGRNLVVNGGAEAGTENKVVPGWPTRDGFETEEYGHTSGEWDFGISGCPDCGHRYFRLDWEGGDAELGASQTVDISPAAKPVDAGKVTIRIGGYFGTVTGMESTDYLTVTYKDAAGKNLGALQTPPLDPARLPQPKVGSASLMPLKADGTVPPQTRSLEVRLSAKRTGPGLQGLGLADNLSVVLEDTSAPQR